jgi:glyoxylase-like metal-dependent hydrolase (beta-lactamase superfamily II)
LKPESKLGPRDVARGLWIWRPPHPHWTEKADWQRMVTSTYVKSRGERVVIDALAPPRDAKGVWKRLDSHPPTVAIVTMPDHVRDVDLFVRLYGCRAFGPRMFWPDDVPKSKLEPVISERKLPGGLMPLHDGRGRLETPIWLPEQRVIVFGDALTERAGQLRVWNSPWHKQRELPALKAMLKLPFERIIISHCDTEPVQARAAFERALELPPWTWTG